MSRIDGGIRGQREQIIPDTFDEFFVIAEGEIRSAHRAVEEAVAREDAFCVRKVEGDAAWRMTGSGKKRFYVKKNSRLGEKRNERIQKNSG